jgi:hypothetical protein
MWRLWEKYEGSGLVVRDLTPQPAEYQISTLKTVMPLQMRVLMAVY